MVAPDTQLCVFLHNYTTFGNSVLHQNMKLYTEPYSMNLMRIFFLPISTNRTKLFGVCVCACRRDPQCSE